MYASCRTYEKNFWENKQCAESKIMVYLVQKCEMLIQKIFKIPTGQDSVILVNCSYFRIVRLKLAEQFNH